MAPSLQISDAVELKAHVKQVMIENLMLKMGPEEIKDDQPLFGPNGIGLDSVDALQLVVALEKNFGLKVADPDAARKVLKSVDSIAEAVMAIAK